MADVLTRDLIAYDPLSEITRKERRALLGVAMIGIALVKIPLVPTKLSAFGLEFSTLNQKALVGLYALVIGYFLVAFLLYALTDYVAWRRSQAINYREYVRQDLLVRKSLGAEAEEEALSKVANDGCPYRGLASYQAAQFASWLRAVFEFMVPVVIATYSISILLAYAPEPSPISQPDRQQLRCWFPPRFALRRPVTFLAAYPKVVDEYDAHVVI